MSAPWPECKLREVADVRVSNVDKKVYSSETPIRLCNYMDVYANDYVSNVLDFMEGSASSAEIARFSLRKGDVIITKDSETPDDIGVPAVIAEDIPDLVCGYHLAMIRPKSEEMDSVFLAKLLSSSEATRYFALNASGSTRFGLPIGAIENIRLPKPLKIEQSKIAEVLSTVDRAIEQTEALIGKQQRIKTGLMQDLLTHGIDEHGNLRSEQTHQYKDSPLGRIPVEWDVENLDNCVRKDAPICYGILMPGTGHDGGVPVIKVKDVIGGKILTENLLLTSPKIDKEYKRSRLRPGDVLITIRGTTGRVAMVPDELDQANITQDTARIRLTSQHSNLFLYFLLQSFSLQDQIDLHTLGQAVKGINIGEVRKLLFGLPKKDEQDLISARLQSLEEVSDSSKAELKKLHSLKTALMQDLLTGERRVTALMDLSDNGGLSEEKNSNSDSQSQVFGGAHG